MRLVPRITCTAPYVFYRCQSNGFNGCCLVDPCALPDCPSHTNTDSPTSSGPSNTAANTDITSSGTDAPASSTAESVPGVVQTPSTMAISSMAATSTSSGEISSVATTTTLSSSPLNSFLSAAGSAAQAFSSAAAQQTSSTNPTKISGGGATAAATTSTVGGAHAQGSSSSINKAPIIGGVVGGVGGVLLLVLLLWRWWMFRRKRTRYEKAQTHDNGSNLQENDLGLTRVSHPDHDSEKTGRSRFWVRNRKPQGSGVSSVGSWDDNGTLSPISPVRLEHGSSPISSHETSPIQSRGSELIAPPSMGGTEGSAPSRVLELSGIPAEDRIAELSPNPERSAINAHQRDPTVKVNPITPNLQAQPMADPSPSSDQHSMHSTLNGPFGTSFSSNYMNRRARARAAPHVTSWMDYEHGVGDAGLQPKQ